MPPLLRALFFEVIQEPVLIDFLRLFGTNDTDLIVFATQTTARVANGMNMELRRFWFSR